MSMTDIKGIVHSDPEIMGGTLVFVDTRVPVASLFQHLKAGDSIEVFLTDFRASSVSKSLRFWKP